MPHPSNDPDDGEPSVVVILHRLALNKQSNYFATLKVDFPPQNQPDAYDEDSVTHRTEVQKSTKQPIFKTRAFCFKLPPSTSIAFSDLLLYSPCLYVQVFEVLRKDERGVAKPFGCATLAFSRDQIESLVSRKTIVQSLVLAANNNGANVGQCDIDVSMSDNSSPPPPSPPSPIASSSPMPEKVRYDSTLHPATTMNGNVLDEAEHLVFTITVHCGVNLGSQNLPPPSPFVTAKTTRDAAAKRPAKTATMMSKNQRNVLWNEKLYVSMSRKDMAEGQGIFLAVIDFETKRYIGKCILPVKGIAFGYQYHMRLLTHEDGYLLISLSVEDKTDNEANRFLKDPDLYHVQLTLKRLLDPVQSQQSNMIAVINLIDDGQAYRQNYIADNVPKIPFDTLLMAEAHDKFGMVKQHWCKVWQFCSPPTLNQLFEFTLERKQRQTNFCLTVEFFYLDFSLVMSSVTPISPMSPLSPATPQSHAPSFPPNPTKESAGIVFWGSAVIPLFELIKAPARTVTINEIEMPVYRSPHIVNYLELDIKRRDAHDYMRDIAPAKEKEKEPKEKPQPQQQGLRARRASDVARGPSPSPLSPQIIRASVSPPARNSPSPQPHVRPGPHAPRSHSSQSQATPTAAAAPGSAYAQGSVYGNLDDNQPQPLSSYSQPSNHRDSHAYQNGIMAQAGNKQQQHSVDLAPQNSISNHQGGLSPSQDAPNSPHFPTANRGSAPRQTFKDLTIIPPSTPSPNADIHHNQVSPQAPQREQNKPRYNNNTNNTTTASVSQNFTMHPMKRGGLDPNAYQQRYRYGEMDESSTTDFTTINDQSIGGRADDRRGGGGINGSDLKQLLEQQQLILQQLMLDREGTNTALKKVEKDLTNLKDENQVLITENNQLKGESQKSSTPELERKLAEVTETQHKMAAMIESLQAENAKIPKYLSSIKSQEKAIHKLESLLKFSISEMKKASKIQADLYAANDTNQKLQQELSASKKGTYTTKPRLAATLDATTDLHSNFDAQKDQVDARIKRVENEMAKNAELLAMELNNLKNRLQQQQDSPLPTIASNGSLSASISPTSSSNGRSKQRESTSSSSSSSSASPTSSMALTSSLSSSATFTPVQIPLLETSASNGNFEKSNWDLYNNTSRTSLNTSRIKARKNMPVKHKETGEYRRPHMLVPMTSPTP